MEKTKVGIVGYGTIGKRVADAVMLQNDMELVGITGHSYNYRIKNANNLGISIFPLSDQEAFTKNGVRPAGHFDDLIDKSDIIVDASPGKSGAENKKNHYLRKGIKAIFQGGEKDDVADISFVAQCNYNEALNKDYVRVVSCNTTGLSRTLHALNQHIGINSVHATMIRRAADPNDIKKGPINSIVPVLEMPSHHGPDVNTVLKDLEVFTTAVKVPSTIMHVHSLVVDLSKEVKTADIVKLFRNTNRVMVVNGAEKVKSTAEIMDLARDLGRNRGDMFETCVWSEGVGMDNKRLFYLQAIHQESDVLPENIDAIRAAMGFDDMDKSIKMTNQSLGIK